MIADYSIRLLGMIALLWFTIILCKDYIWFHPAILVRNIIDCVILNIVFLIFSDFSMSVNLTNFI